MHVDVVRYTCTHTREISCWSCEYTYGARASKRIGSSDEWHPFQTGPRERGSPLFYGHPRTRHTHTIANRRCVREARVRKGLQLLSIVRPCWSDFTHVAPVTGTAIFEQPVKQVGPQPKWSSAGYRADTPGSPLYSFIQRARCYIFKDRNHVIRIYSFICFVFYIYILNYKNNGKFLEKIKYRKLAFFEN